MKQEKDIQMAHDILLSVVTDKVALGRVLTDNDKAEILRVVDVLCWVLEHDHPNGFADLVESLKAYVDRNYAVKYESDSASTWGPEIAAYVARRQRGGKKSAKRPGKGAAN